MRTYRFFVPGLVALTSGALGAMGCGGSPRSFYAEVDAGEGESGPPSTPSGGNGAFAPGGAGDGGGGSGDSGSVTTTTIYGHSDDTLYSLDPATSAVTTVGTFAGTAGTTSDGSITDCAVDGAGNLYVNSATVVYKAALPSGGAGVVQLTKVSTIAAAGGQRFYALAFAPAGVLAAAETLVGGDGSGELWSIDTATGATKDLGSFGPDGANVFGLSGDLLFYTDAAGKPTGLATIRSCKSGGGTCTRTTDYLAGIDMAALIAAFKSGTPAASLLSGIYGGSTTTKGGGVGHGDLFGLGAWEGKVYGFERASANGGKPALVLIDTTTGQGSVLPSSHTFTNGWSGACVTTKVTVTIPPPPASPN